MRPGADRELLAGARKLRAWFGPEIDQVYGSTDAASLLWALQSARPSTNPREAAELSRFIAENRSRTALRRRTRWTMRWTLAGLGALVLGILLTVLLAAVEGRDAALEDSLTTGVGLSFCVFLLWCLSVPILLTLQRPHGHDELRAAFRWAARRPGQAVRGLPVGPPAAPPLGIGQAKSIVRHHFGGPLLVLSGVALAGAGVWDGLGWLAGVGVALIPAGLWVHRWSAGNHDPKAAAHQLLARHVCSLGANEFGLHADGATLDPETDRHGPTPVRVVFPGTRGLPRDELEHRIYFARHSPDVAGNLVGRPRHPLTRARIVWEITGDGALACTLAIGARPAVGRHPAP